ncbi:MAG: GTP 3',8-cyclase MoaA [Proteobacteria bacterium]|nr:GTP 3',8-cyclase MoaA [Pseudomonadota bacterium]
MTGNTLAAPPTPLRDARGRALRDLRISVTDRCNFRCGYCMPKSVFSQTHRFLPHADLLRHEETARVAAAFVSLGVHKLRLTGGEPLLRKGLPELVAQLAALRTHAGRAPDIALTTNGTLLARQAPALRAAGLTRLTVSVDALDDALFQRINDVGVPVAQVLDGIDAALAAGFGPIKLNMVVQRGVNDHEIVPLAAHVRARWGTQAVLRFIEFMDVGTTNGWRMDQVLPADAVRERLHAQWPLEPLDAQAPGETARRWRYADGGGEVGFIASVTRAFCHDCNRVRLSALGRLYGCLFASQGNDLRALLRGGASDAELAAHLTAFWQARDDRYSELRGQGQVPEQRIEMHYIGG